MNTNNMDKIGAVCCDRGYFITFYEDPDYGDEVELIAIISGQPVRSPWFELPGRYELGDWLRDLGVVV